MSWEEFWTINLGKEWKHSLPFLHKYNYIISTIGSKEFYPKKSDVFRAFRLTSPDQLKVVILGQDPYPVEGKATGLAFANFNDDPRSVSPSLKVIWNCIESKFHNGFMLDFDFSLESWAEQGILLLNTALTVEPGKAGSHIELWKSFTRELLSTISTASPDIIFVLWGKYAEQYEDCCTNVLKHTHPAHSIYTHTRWDCPNFEQVNELLIKQGKTVIKW